MPTRSQVKKSKLLKGVEEDSSLPRSAGDKLQFNVPKDVADDRKVKEKDVFEGWKDTKKGKSSKTGKSSSKKPKK